MPVPKRKLSRKRRDQRSANKGIKPQSMSRCQTCQSPIMPHKVCSECGYYKGIKVLRTKTDRLYARGQAREAQSAALNASASANQAQAGQSEQQ